MKPDVLDKYRTGLEIASIDLDLETNLLHLSDVELGFEVKTNVTVAKRKDNVPNQEFAKFKREGQRFVTSEVKKDF